MTLESKISQAKAKLLVEYPYFGTLAAKLTIVSNDNIMAFRSDGEVIEYRDEYLKGLSIDELGFIFANGAMHATLAHQNRKSKRTSWLWQMATDMAVNDMLVENGMSLPYAAQYQKRFKGMYAEEIYALLKADRVVDDEEFTDEQKEYTQETEDHILQEELFAQESITLLERVCEKGETPCSIERFFTLNSITNVDWKEELKIAIEYYYRDDYRVLPPSKKLLYSGIYLPSAVSQTLRFVIVIDSSGSIDEKLLSDFLSEVNFLVSFIHRYEIELLVSDDKIHFHKKFVNGELLEIDVKGGGSTDFRVAFRYVDEYLDDVKLLLYFTDMEGIFPEEEPNYEVCWITKEPREAPFGKVIQK